MGARVLSKQTIVTKVGMLHIYKQAFINKRVTTRGTNICPL